MSGADAGESADENTVVLLPILKEYLNWLIQGFPTAGKTGVLQVHPRGQNWRDKFPQGPIHVMLEPATWIEQYYPKKDWENTTDGDRRKKIRDLFTLVCDIILCDPLVFAYDKLICHPDWQVREKPKSTGKCRARGAPCHATDDTADGPVVGVRPPCIHCGSNEHTTATDRGWSFAAGKAVIVRGKYKYAILVGKPIKCTRCQKSYVCTHASAHTRTHARTHAHTHARMHARTA